MWMRSLLAEEDGDTTTAISTLAEVWDTFGAFDIPSGRQWIGPRLARLALLDGDRDRAKAVAHGLDEGAARRAVVVPRRRRAQAWGLVEGEPERALKAVGLARMTARKPQLADALLDAASVLRGLGASSDADDAALEASSLYTAMGADTWAMQAVATMSGKAGGRHGQAPRGPRFGWESISQSERHVLDLLADGLSNVGSRRACTSPRRTVESHVSSAYRKLGLSTRASSSPSQCWPTGTSPIEVADSATSTPWWTSSSMTCSIKPRNVASAYGPYFGPSWSNSQLGPLSTSPARKFAAARSRMSTASLASSVKWRSVRSVALRPKTRAA